MKYRILWIIKMNKFNHEYLNEKDLKHSNESFSDEDIEYIRNNL